MKNRERRLACTLYQVEFQNCNQLNVYVCILLGIKKKQYARRGPTYDEESLKQSSASAVPSTNKEDSAILTVLSSLGRGRGRGRAIPTQPLRRPNVPGVAARGGREPVQSEAAASSIANVELPWQGSLGAGRGKGRGVRPPNTTPKVWAGSVSAPHPSTAPLPPTAWQSDYGLMPGSSPLSYPWPLQPNDNMSSNAPMFSAFPGPKFENYSSLGAANNQHTTGKENIDNYIQEELQNFSLFDKDSYDY